MNFMHLSDIYLGMLLVNLCNIYGPFKPFSITKEKKHQCITEHLMRLTTSYSALASSGHDKAR